MPMATSWGSGMPESMSQRTTRAERATDSSQLEAQVPPVGWLSVWPSISSRLSMTDRTSAAVDSRVSPSLSSSACPLANRTRPSKRMNTPPLVDPDLHELGGADLGEGLGQEVLQVLGVLGG